MKKFILIITILLATLSLKAQFDWTYWNLVFDTARARTENIIFDSSLFVLDTIDAVEIINTDKWYEIDDNVVIKLTRNDNMSLGTNALANITVSSGNYNTGAGSLAGNAVTTGDNNSLFGYKSGYALTTTSNNTLIGYNSGISLTGSNNTLIGSDVGHNATGSNNTYLGYTSGYNGTGSDNIFIGYQSGYNETGSDLLYIDNSSTASPLIHGDFTADSITINGQLNVTESFRTTYIDTLAVNVPNSTVTMTNYNNFVINSTGDIDSLTITVPNYAVIYIEFTGNAAANGIVDGQNLKLAGNFTFTIDDTMILQRRDGYYFELSRSVN